MKYLIELYHGHDALRNTQHKTKQQQQQKQRQQQQKRQELALSGPSIRMGSGDSSVVRAPDSWLKGRGFESLLERRDNFFLRGQLFGRLLFRYPFHPRVTAVVRRRPRSFCLKRRRQVTAKHAYTLRMWLCMKWYGAWLYGVHRTCAKTTAVSWGTSHASAVSTPLRCIFKKRATKS